VAPLASGLSHSFDSLEATQRLAVLTGAATVPPPAVDRQSTTQAIHSLPAPTRASWRRRDWLLVGGATVLGALVARAIVKKE
jgi:hypothetical protein